MSGTLWAETEANIGCLLSSTAYSGCCCFTFVQSTFSLSCCVLYNCSTLDMVAGEYVWQLRESQGERAVEWDADDADSQLMQRDHDSHLGVVGMKFGHSCGGCGEHQYVSKKSVITIMTLSYDREMVGAGEISGNSRARMIFKQYWSQVVVRLRVVLEGWPHEEKIAFADLSLLKTAQLEILLARWTSGTLFFRRINEAEFAEMRAAREAQIAAGEINEEAARKERKDRGQRWYRTNPETRTKTKRSKGPFRSSEIVENSDVE